MRLSSLGRGFIRTDGIYAGHNEALNKYLHSYIYQASFCTSFWQSFSFLELFYIRLPLRPT